MFVQIYFLNEVSQNHNIPAASEWSAGQFLKDAITVGFKSSFKSLNRT